MRKALLFTLLMSFLAFVTPAHADNLVFGVYASESPSELFGQYRPIIDALQEYLRANGKQVTIDVKITTGYDESIDNLARGVYDFSNFGPASYVLAKQKNPKIRLLAMENDKGRKFFKGIFIANQKSGIKSIKDLKAKKLKFAFGNERSTIGRYLAQAYLVKNDITNKNLAAFAFLGRHDKVATAVALNEYDVGVVRQSVLEKYSDRGLVKLEEFDNVTQPWIAGEKMSAEVFALVQKFLLSLKKGDASLTPLKIDGFFPTSDDDYKEIVEAIKLSEKF